MLEFQSRHLGTGPDYINQVRASLQVCGSQSLVYIIFNYRRLLPNERLLSKLLPYKVRFVSPDCTETLDKGYTLILVTSIFR